MLNFRGTQFIVESDEKVWSPEVTVVFGNLVLENEVVAERIPRQFGDESMVLVQIVAIVRKNQVGLKRFLN